MSANDRRISDKYKGTPTVIGNDSSFTGELKGEAPVIVLGTVTGECQLERTLTIEKSGKWVGTIQAQDLVVNGTIEGDVNAGGKLEIGASGHIKGNVRAGFLAIAEGAVIEGDIQMTGAKEPLHFVEKRKA